MKRSSLHSEGVEVPAKKEVGNSLKLRSLVALFTITLALFSTALHAQPPYVYANLNNPSTGANTVWGMKLGPPNLLTFIGGEPVAGWAAGGTSAVYLDALKDQALYANTDGPNLPPCLYVSEPLPSPGYPNGDISAFTIAPLTGVLTAVGRYATPAGIVPPFNGIALTPGHKLPALFAGYSAPFPGTNYIVVWRINQNTCALTYQQQTVATPLNGGSIDGMDESMYDDILVAAFADGSIESFSTIPGFTISPGCPVNSTGYITQGSLPSGVDITHDEKYAIFGDAPGGGNNITEVEMVPLPITCSSVTTDFGGAAHANSFFPYLGNGVNSTNIWLGPEEHNLFVTNNISGQVTTIRFHEGLYPTPATMTLAGPCFGAFTNPTALKPPAPGIPFLPDGMQTSVVAAANPLRLYVGEFTPVGIDAIALLRVQLGTGCTNETAASPYLNPGQVLGSQLSAYPPRVF